MSTILTILYEDQIGVELKSFGLHNLLLRCVCDELNDVAPWELGRRIEGHPKKGDAGVIRALEVDGRRLMDSGHLIALVDDDKIRRRLGLEKGSCRRIVADGIRSKAVGCDVVLLVTNTETLLKSCEQLLGGALNSEKPDPVTRDRLFNKFANATTPVQRLCLRENVPSFDRLVKRVVDWYQTN